MDVVSPSLEKTTVSLMLGKHISVNAFFTDETKRAVNLGVELLHSPQPNHRTRQLRCDAGRHGLDLAGFSYPRPENLSKCAFQMGINSMNSTH